MLLFALRSVAQIATADILGTVTDSSGSVIPAATVTVTNLATSARFETRSDSAGNYVVSLLPPGRYRVRVEQAGFRAWETTDLQLSVADRRRVDAQLAVGEVSQTLEVVAHQVALQTDTSTIAQVVSARAVQDLPLNGRNFISMAQVVPGASEGPPNGESTGARPDDRRQSSAVSVNGQRTQVNVEMVDGMSNNEKVIGAIGVRPSIDGIAEFVVQTNVYTAEVGRTAGAVINIVTKSGTNDFHGSVYEFLRNDKLDANDFFTNAVGQSIPEYRQNQFGGSLGGPIKKSKSFFFIDYEGLRIVQGTPQTATIPAQGMRQGVFTGISRVYDPLTSPRLRFPDDVIPPSRLDPIALKLLTTYPDPTSLGLANNYHSALNKTYFGHTGDARFDQQLSDVAQLFARVTINKVATYIPGQMPKTNGLINSGAPLLSSGPADVEAVGPQVQYVRTIRPNLLLSLRGAYLYFDNFTMPLNGTAPGAASFGIKGADDTVTFSQFWVAPYATLGDASYTPLRRTAGNYQFNGGLSWQKGSHNAKFGAGAERLRETTYQFASAGSWTFDNNLTNNPATDQGGGNSIASLLLGFPSGGGTRSARSILPHQRWWLVHLYAQDDWRATRWLTFNIGLRYEVFTPATEGDNYITNFDLGKLMYIRANTDGYNSHAGVKTNWNDLGPRFGFAATLGRQTVLRGGYGISYWADWTGQGQLGTAQEFLVASPSRAYTGPSGLPPNYTLAGGYDPMVPYGRNPAQGAVNYYIFQFKDASAQQFNLTLEKAFGNYVVSIGYVGILGRHLYVQPQINNAPPGLGAIQSRRPYYSALPLVTGITAKDSMGRASYNAMQLVAQRRLSQGLTFNANFTWAHALNDVSDGQTGGNQNSNLSTNQFLDYHHMDWGNSDTDVRRRLAFTANYELPFGKSLAGVAKRVAGDWQVNALAGWSTGLPYTVMNQTSLSNTGFGSSNVSSNDRPSRIGPGTLPSPTLTKWFDAAAFVPQTFGTFGNSGRNIMRGPRQFHLDFSVFRTFNVSERLRLQFRAESFNLSNTASFAQPNFFLGAPGFASVTAVQPQTTPREVQFALKLLF
jgi:hypothetical protein